MTPAQVKILIYKGAAFLRLLCAKIDADY